MINLETFLMDPAAEVDERLLGPEASDIREQAAQIASESDPRNRLEMVSHLYREFGLEDFPF